MPQVSLHCPCGLWKSAPVRSVPAVLAASKSQRERVCGSLRVLGLRSSAQCPSRVLRLLLAVWVLEMAAWTLLTAVCLSVEDDGLQPDASL